MLDLQNTPPFLFRAGSSPIVISIPHNGSVIPISVAEKMTADGQSSRDTDWFLDRLYDFPESADASKLVAQFSRYVVDLNRSSDDVSLYPGQTTTGLIPKQCFDGAAIYKDDAVDAGEISERIEKVWQPYHQKLADELARVRDEHSFAVLIEAHSIKSVVPRLFDGTLPDFNFGTNRGQSCSSKLASSINEVLEQQSDYSHVQNGRFVGGYITRHFGDPSNNIHAVQIELSQATYMDEDNLSWSDEKAAKVQPVFQQIFQAVSEWTQQQ